MKMDTDIRIDHRLPLVLLCLRLSVFLVMSMWTLDKFLRPEHASAVFQKYYFIGGMGHELIYLFGILEMVLLVGFLLGIKKQWTYSAVLLLHGVSTLSAYQNYLAPFTGPNLLFFAAWPMLAACAGLYILKDHDTRWVVKIESGNEG